MRHQSAVEIYPAYWAHQNQNGTRRALTAVVVGHMQPVDVRHSRHHRLFVSAEIVQFLRLCQDDAEMPSGDMLF
jgi:hypothetical protein